MLQQLKRKASRFGRRLMTNERGASTIQLVAVGAVTMSILFGVLWFVQSGGGARLVGTTNQAIDNQNQLFEDGGSLGSGWQDRPGSGGQQGGQGDIAGGGVSAPQQSSPSDVGSNGAPNGRKPSVWDRLGNAWDGAKSAANSAWDSTKEAAATVWDGAKEVAGGVWNGAKGAARTAWSWTKKGAGNLWSAMADNPLGTALVVLVFAVATIGGVIVVPHIIAGGLIATALSAGLTALGMGTLLDAAWSGVTTSKINEWKSLGVGLSSGIGVALSVLLAGGLGQAIGRPIGAALRAIVGGASSAISQITQNALAGRDLLGWDVLLALGVGLVFSYNTKPVPAEAEVALRRSEINRLVGITGSFKAKARRLVQAKAIKKGVEQLAEKTFAKNILKWIGGSLLLHPPKPGEE